jgi:outer membrane lipoprotein-sorting protein
VGTSYGSGEYQKKIKSYLNGMHALKATFKQYNPDGTLYVGDLWIKRYKDKMGKMRLDYQGEGAQRIVANEGVLIIYEADGNENVYNVDHTPAGFILRSDIDFEKDLTVKGCEKSEDGQFVFLKLVRSGDDDGPSLTLAFKLTPSGGIAKLAMWEVLDIQGNRTVVEIEDDSVRVNDTRLVEDTLFKPPFKQ